MRPLLGPLAVGKPIAIFQFKKRVEGRVVDFNASNHFDLQPDLQGTLDPEVMAQG